MDPTIPGTAQLQLLTEQQRERIARHADNEVSDRVFRELSDRAALAQSEYRFMDLMDRIAAMLVGGVVLALAVSLVLPQGTLRWIDQACHGLVVGHAGAETLVAIVVMLPVGLFALMLYLRRKVMGRHWLRSEARLPWTHCS